MKSRRFLAHGFRSNGPNATPNRYAHDLIARIHHRSNDRGLSPPTESDDGAAARKSGGYWPASANSMVRGPNTSILTAYALPRVQPKGWATHRGWRRQPRSYPRREAGSRRLASHGEELPRFRPPSWPGDNMNPRWLPTVARAIFLGGVVLPSLSLWTQLDE
jgi:hypothetical protein